MSDAWTVAGRVVDLETKAPVPQFRVVKVEFSRLGAESGVAWRESRPVDDESGRYRANFDTLGPSRRVVRIEAEGYLSSEAQWMKVGQRKATFNIELTKGQPVTGVVLAPDGKPLADADVALCTASRGLYLGNGRPALNQHPLIARTGPDGRFSFAPQREPYVLVATHEQGFAQAEDEQGMKEITIQPWARIEGTLRIGDKPAVKNGHVLFVQFSDLVRADRTVVDANLVQSSLEAVGGRLRAE